MTYNFACDKARSVCLNIAIFPIIWKKVEESRWFQLPAVLSTSGGASRRHSSSGLISSKQGYSYTKQIVDGARRSRTPSTIYWEKIATA
ncbi:hypothetical protein [Pseudanabaena galeata]|uniref:hypothetical protein n=1 Tax=Pseudanabaena galeata TaxID=1112103 RepID=UPI0024785186|nr:hypothetical protein [Pseudanabaena galeata]MEA5485603.1 hypothetical protein [Pseudanabaena sp. CCNP1317]WGS70740.1 hypothetical protein OA858_13490 [Pseudanabaena galeata CCNP1313]